MTDLFGTHREISLYAHQDVAVEHVRGRMREGARRVILVAPTAFGKTECAAWIIQQSMSKGMRAWFIVCLLYTSRCV